MTIRHKKRFIVYTLLYAIGYVFYFILGPIITQTKVADHPALVFSASTTVCPLT